MVEQKSFSYDEAYAATLDYFNGDEVPAKTFVDKYPLKDNDNQIVERTPDGLHNRMAHEFARIDADKYGLDYDERRAIYRDAMDHFARIVPQGSPMAAIGNPYRAISASNCVVVASPEDSIEGIFKTGLDLAQLYKRRCVAASSTVVTKEHGVISIEHVEPGMHVLSYDLDERKSAYNKVLDKFESDVEQDDRIILRYSNGTELRTSKKHPVLELGEQGFGYIDAGKISTGSINVRPEELDLSALNNGDWDSDQTKEHEVAWFIGAHIGDGSADRVVVGDDRGRYDRIRFRISGDNEEVVNSYKNIHNFMTKNSSNYHESYRHDYQTTCWEFSSSVVGNEVIAADLLDNQIGSKTYSAFVPSAVDDDFKMWSFIAGLIDTDGTIKQEGQQIVIGICSAAVINEVSAFLQSKGVGTHLIVRDAVRDNEHTIYQLAIHYSQNLWQGIANRLCHDEKRNALRAYEGRVHSLRKPITQGEYNYILKMYDSMVKDWKDPYHKLLAANIYYMKNAEVRGVGKAFMSQLVDLGFFSPEEAAHIMNRVSVVSVIQDTVSERYYDLEVDVTNNFYCGNFGLEVIHNCGVGIDISSLRPEGMCVNNAARTTSGAWSFAELYSAITNQIGQHGRRGASMITIDVHHPDVVSFAKMKRDKTKVTGANVSVRLSNEFMRAVENDIDYEQRWPLEGNPRFVRKVSARKVWNTIIESATMCAEPGVIMWGHMTENLPAHSYPQFKTVSTNPCCFDKSSDVWVITKTGIKEIKQVTSRDLIWVDESQAWRETTGYFDAGNAEVFKVSLSNNESLYVTANHKLERMTRGLDGDRKVDYQRQLVEVNKLSEGDFIALHEHVVATADYSSNVGTYEDGVLLGWLTGDGCLSYKEAGDIWPVMYLSCWSGEYDVAEKLLKMAQQYVPGLGLQEYNDGHGNLIKRVASLGLTRSLTEKYEINLWNFKSGFNSFLYQASTKFIQGYLSAYFSADGTVASTPQNSRYAVQLASVDADRLEQIRNILCLFGIRSHVGLVKKAARTKIRDRFYECADCYRLTISGYENLKKFNDFIGFLSDTKQEKLLEALDNFKREGRTSAVYAKVVSIESVGVRETGCIKVKGEPKFTANGIISGNSEIALSAYDSCRLISINLTAYVRNAFESDATFDYESFQQDIRTAMQMADNLVDLELELIERIKDVIGRDEEGIADRCKEHGISSELTQIIAKKFNDFSEVEIWNKLKKAGEQGRRTGVGTHGLGDTLAQLCIRYDGEDAMGTVDAIYRTLRDTAYQASIDLAKARGPFPAFDWDTEKNNAYIKRLPDEIREQLAEFGRRNISMLTQAPTGSVSMISKCGEFETYNISSGVEPAFKAVYVRRKKVNAGDEHVRVDYTDKNGCHWQEFSVYHGNVLNYYAKKGIEIGTTLPDYFVFAGEINGTRRIQIQGIEQQYIDHSISSTINLPEDTPPEVVADLYMKAWKHKLKGVTVYREGSRDGVLISETDSKKRLKELEELVQQLEEKLERRSLIPESHAPHRPDTLESRTHKIKVDFGDGNPKNTYVTISFFPGTMRPYEIFLQAPLTGLDEKDLQILELAARSTSMNLRHGLPIQYICEQLDKVGGQYLYSIPISLAKVLRNYIDPITPEQETETDISVTIPTEGPPSRDSNGMLKCPDCRARTYRMIGKTCGICDSCGFSGCD